MLVDVTISAHTINLPLAVLIRAGGLINSNKNKSRPILQITFYLPFKVTSKAPVDNNCCSMVFARKNTIIPAVI